jgi:hypothetical protein
MTWKWDYALLGNVNTYVLYPRKTTEISQLACWLRDIGKFCRRWTTTLQIIAENNLKCPGRQLLTGQKLVPLVCPSCYFCYCPHCECRVKCSWFWYWSSAVDIHCHWKIFSHFVARGRCLQGFASQDLCRAVRYGRTDHYEREQIYLRACGPAAFSQYRFSLSVEQHTAKEELLPCFQTCVNRWQV